MKIQMEGVLPTPVKIQKIKSIYIAYDDTTLRVSIIL
jgi:hypothetical protein